jgi:hypothetical protein
MHQDEYWIGFVLPIPAQLRNFIYESWMNMVSLVLLHHKRFHIVLQGTPFLLLFHFLQNAHRHYQFLHYRIEQQLEVST